jgi:hypothetical protein
MRNNQLSDESVLARATSMTLAEKLELVEACERMWNGTDQQWMAENLRKLYETDKLRIN